MSGCERTLRFASAGLGHGSTAMIVGMVLGLDGMPPLTLATFADTGSERPETYRHAVRFTIWLAEHGVRLQTVMKGDVSGSLHQSIIDRSRGQRKSASPIPLHLKPGEPFWVEPHDDAFGNSVRGYWAEQNSGRSLQGCTRDWKMRPLDQAHKRYWKANGRGPAEVCIGYTSEEVARIPAPSKYGWEPEWTPRYPLIEAGWNRGKCIEIIAEHLGWPVVSSCCIMCPHKPTTGKGSFDELLQADPESFSIVEMVDEAVRAGDRMGLRADGYLSAMRVPVRQAIEIAKRQQVFGFAQGDGSCDGGTCWT